MVLNHNDIQNIPDHTIVYGYMCRTHSSVFKNRKVGKVSKHMVLSRGNWGKQVARIKQDGNPYAKESCSWTHNFFLSKQEADNARLDSIVELKKGLQEEIDSLQTIVNAY